MRKLLRYYLPYKRLLLLALVCNILMSVFMVVSIPVLQPFLQILFNSNNGSAASNKTNAFLGLEGKLNHFFSDLINTHGQESALLIVCIFLVLTFLGKNLFRYLSLYFLAGVRNGIVKEHDKNADQDGNAGKTRCPKNIGKHVVYLDPCCAVHTVLFFYGEISVGGNDFLPNRAALKI